ncbi:ubiquinol-cytochrome C chaperone [Sphingomonas koreensis]|nr:ubiquinol-cytochrome C chaperone [Sphingomonas koreensis]
MRDAPGRQGPAGKGNARTRRVGLFARLFKDRDAATVAALYEAIVARARAPHWYLAGGVPDSVDGRFDMVAAILSLVLLRLEGDPDGPAPSALLAERFVRDMDGQLRELGIGDIVVGKHIGKMMGMLGGRLGAYRDGLAGGDLDGAITRNIYRGAAPSAAALAEVRDGLITFRDSLAATPTPDLLAGKLP